MEFVPDRDRLAEALGELAGAAKEYRTVVAGWFDFTDTDADYDELNAAIVSTLTAPWLPLRHPQRATAREGVDNTASPAWGRTCRSSPAISDGGPMRCVIEDRGRQAGSLPARSRIRARPCRTRWSCG